MSNTSPIERPVTNGGGPMMDPRMGNLFHEVMPQLKLSDLILPDIVSKTLQSWAARSVTVAQQDEP